MKYKIGDRVKTIDSIGIDSIIPIGSEGTIIDVNYGDKDYEIDFDCDDRCWFANDEQVKLISETITKETKIESFEKIQPLINDRHEQCIEGLKVLGNATANELAMYLFSKGTTPYFSRNFVHPRLNELVELGKVEVIGKRLDSITDRKCAIYKIKETKVN